MLYNKPFFFTTCDFLPLDKIKTYNFKMNETDLKKLLGNKIKKFRNKLGLTQEEFGEKINRTQRQVSLIEVGSSFPNPETLANITNVLNCSLKDLFDFEPQENTEFIKEKLHQVIENASDEKLRTIYSITKTL